MIILDPDLDTSATHAKAARRSDGSAKRAIPSEDRVPSARTLERYLREARTAVKLRGLVTVLLTTDEAMRGLNRKFRGKDRTTDVLSFPAGAPVLAEIAGDLAISVPTARRQAAERDHSLSTEIKVLILHGLLHLAGYDHEKDRGEMFRRERALRAKLRLPHGLIERTDKPASAPRTRNRSRTVRSKRP